MPFLLHGRTNIVISNCLFICSKLGCITIETHEFESLLDVKPGHCKANFCSIWQRVMY